MESTYCRPLLCMMYRHGYGAAERIRMEIRRAWQFRFDWYFKSRSAQEIQKRCDTIVKIVEREIEEVRKKEKEAKDQAEAKADAADTADVPMEAPQQQEEQDQSKEVPQVSSEAQPTLVTGIEVAAGAPTN